MLFKLFEGISIDSIRLLFKNKFTEELGTVETGLGPVDGVPRDKMRCGKIVATFIEIGSHTLATPTLDTAAE